MKNKNTIQDYLPGNSLSFMFQFNIVVTMIVHTDFYFLLSWVLLIFFS